MRYMHRFNRFLRTVVFFVVALALAGYPYLIFSGYVFQTREQLLVRGLLIFAILVSAFAAVGYAAYIDSKRRKEEQRSMDS